MSPAAHALDRRLHALRAARDGVATALVALEADETFKLLAARGGLSGATAARVRPALARLAELRPGMAALDELLAWASGLRSSSAMDDGRATELVSMLNSPSLLLPAPEAGLRATRQMAPQDLLDGLEQAVEPMRALVTEIDALWKELPLRLERTAGEAERLALELPAFRSVVTARSTVAELPTRVVNDPIGAADDLTRVQAALAEAQSARGDVARLDRVLKAAAGTLAEIEAQIDEGRRALDRSLAETHEPWGLLDPLDAELLGGERGLRPWLGRLQRLVGEGRCQLAETGLASWQALADQTLDAARQVAAANVRPIARREELQRLLGAARVKARASGRAEDPRVAQLADQAQRALLVPCDIDAAENRVDAYIDALRRRPRAVGPGHVATSLRELSA
jgi:hypothetical protein